MENRMQNCLSPAGWQSLSPPSERPFLVLLTILIPARRREKIGSRVNSIDSGIRGPGMCWHWNNNEINVFYVIPLPTRPTMQLIKHFECRTAKELKDILRKICRKSATLGGRIFILDCAPNIHALFILMAWPKNTFINNTKIFQKLEPQFFV